MSCWHGPHGCGRDYQEACDVGWWEPADWRAAPDRPIRRGAERPRRLEPGIRADDLETRLEQLRRMVRQIENELADLHGASQSNAAT